MQVCRIKQEFQEKVKERVDQNQKEYILREQLKLIREELGEDSESEAEEFEEQLSHLRAGKEIKDRITKEINRYRAMPAGSQEAYVSRNYVENLLELPWEKHSRDNKDLGKAEAILEADHYGMEEIKERIMEFLAVRSADRKGRKPDPLSGRTARNRKDIHCPLHCPGTQ